MATKKQLENEIEDLKKMREVVDELFKDRFIRCLENDEEFRELIVSELSEELTDRLDDRYKEDNGW